MSVNVAVPESFEWVRDEVGTSPYHHNVPQCSFYCSQPATHLSISLFILYLATGSAAGAYPAGAGTHGNVWRCDTSIDGRQARELFASWAGERDPRMDVSSSSDATATRVDATTSQPCHRLVSTLMRCAEYVSGCELWAFAREL